MSYRRGSNTRAEGSSWFLPRGLRSDGVPQQASAPTAKEARARPVKGQPGVVYGPERVRDLKKGNDLVVGERTVVKQAAHYGVLRGMLWCVVLGALLFWLPVLGPALAGYVGGRRSGGPVRAVVAVAIPAAVLLMGLAYLDANFGIVPSASTLPGDYDLGPLADVREAGSPIAAALTAAVEGWVAAPPDFFFIMGVFALAGGALSSLRRAEEETVIERLGIPLGEVKDRARAGEFGIEAQEAMQGPVWRRSRHPAVVAPVAAHDGMHELVEMIVDGVADRMGAEQQRPVPTARLIPRPGRRGILHRGVAHGPALESMQSERGTYGHPEGATARHHGGRSTGGRRDDVEVMEVWEEVPPVQAAVGWAKPPRRKATRPMRMGPGGAIVPRESRRTRAVKASGGRTRTGWLPRRQRAPPAYTANSEEGELRSAIEALSMDTVPAGASRAHKTPRRQPDHVSKRLPITSSILGIPDEGEEADAGDLGGPAGAEAEARAKAKRPEADYIPRNPKKTTFAREAGGGVSVVAKSTMEEFVEPAPEHASAPAPSLPQAAMIGPRPSAALRGRSRKVKASGEYEEDLAEPGMIVWTAKGGEDGTDYFQGKRGRTAAPTAEGAAASGPSAVAADGAATPDQPDWEEERIAAMVREREEWDRL